MSRPGLGFGMRHVALFVRDMAACEQFYVNLLGMEVEWRPDEHMATSVQRRIPQNVPFVSS